MSPYKPDEDISHPEFYHNDQPVPITLDVEHIMLVSNIIRRGEIEFDVRQGRPLRIFHYLIPSLQGYFRIFPSSKLFTLKILKFNRYNLLQVDNHSAFTLQQRYFHRMQGHGHGSDDPPHHRGTQASLRGQVRSDRIIQFRALRRSRPGGVKLCLCRPYSKNSIAGP